MAYTEAQKNATMKYIKANLQPLRLRYKKEIAEEIQEYCKNKNIPVATFIRQAIDEKKDRVEKGIE